MNIGYLAVGTTLLLFLIAYLSLKLEERKEKKNDLKR